MRNVPLSRQLESVRQFLHQIYDGRHSIKCKSASFEAAAKLSVRYHAADIYLPDKDIDLLSEAGVLVLMDHVVYILTVEAGSEPQVTEQTVANAISEWSNIPMGKQSDRLMILEDELIEKGVKGRAVRAVSMAIRRGRSGLRCHSSCSLYYVLWMKF